MTHLHRTIMIVALIALFSFTMGCKQDTQQSLKPPAWVPVSGNQFNMIVTGKVFRNGVQLSSNDYYVATFGSGGIQSDCRSLNQVASGRFYATVRGETNGDAIQFMVWNMATEKAVQTTESVTFQADDLKADFQINFTE